MFIKASATPSRLWTRYAVRRCRQGNQAVCGRPCARGAASARSFESFGAHPHPPPASRLDCRAGKGMEMETEAELGDDWDDMEGGLELEISVLLEEGVPADVRAAAMEELLEADAGRLLHAALLETPSSVVQGLQLPETVFACELSVMLCGDCRIRELNKEWRSKDAATDVLSFPQQEWGSAMSPVGLLALGDVVISVETAARQAVEAGHSLVDELRVLLVHGLLHLLGHDHEGQAGQAEAAAMAKQEQRLLQGLGWGAEGLITKAAIAGQPSPRTPSGGVGGSHGSVRPKLLLLDMDGTLLNSQVQITELTAAAVKAAADAGVTVALATGKARPAAERACRVVGLAGDDGVVGPGHAGVFLQGLVVYGAAGELIHLDTLPNEICEELLLYSEAQGVPLTAFCGDRCKTLASHWRLDELHEKYYEPVSEVVGSVEELLGGASGVNKMLFCMEPEQVQAELRPYWAAALHDRAAVVQAVPNMLEILPLGSSKGAGVEILLQRMGVPAREVMAIGDGENDKEMLQLAGIGVAMGNAVPPTCAVADHRVGSNDEDGVAEAIEKFILDPARVW
ncbi:hypothetical protein CYMTET_48163 [Cymbomonas tetramitiformis]|uniref:Uncharacterized protein n=1 Tax=Cymbomonas tetramitiformis TaxID=36881 RepID=A0AAE0BSU3_9CHLO|nr:hypothetical protein CYMTET_48163 [Cymbomonas tetramitiformis]